MAWPEPVTLRGTTATLAPLSAAHHDDLVVATRDGELWKLWYTFVPSPEKMNDEIARRLGLQDKGSMLPFAVIEAATGKALGMTTYMNIDAANRRVEIGSTWYAKRVQRSRLNTECKMMLLTHAFDTLKMHRSRIPHVVLQPSKAVAPSSAWAPSSTASCATT